MIGVKENRDIYLASFAGLEKKLTGDGRAWTYPLRKAAIQRFAELGFPTTRLEEWKYTSVAPIAATPFQLARYQPGGLDAGRLVSLPFADTAFSAEACRLVFVNGQYCQEASSAGGPGEKVRVASLRVAIKEHSALLEQHLGRCASFEDHAFVALNTALMEDGAFVEIPRGLVAEKPIYLVFVSTTKGQATISHPRNLILVERESQASIVEIYTGTVDEVYFTNAVTEIVAGENSVVDHYKLQNESDRAFHVATLGVRQGRSSDFSSHSISLGGALVRNDLKALLDGEGAGCLLNGLYVTAGRQHVDNHTVIDHAKPHGTSRELYKGILDGKSSAVFNGSIIVRKDAQKTDAKQSNKNLLLSEEATIDSKPQLEINADDVRCTHGTTIGQIDQQAMFYLRSRGIGQEEARHVLTYAFANEIFGRIRVEPVRFRLEQALRDRLSGGPKLREDL